jgi:Ran GTPase-activating protein (RanGAP) involved in mRNA processing and transport
MTLHTIYLVGVNLMNVNEGGRLLSGLHGVNSVTHLRLFDVGLAGTTGGIVISELLQNSLSLRYFMCDGHRLGVEGAQALHASLRANQTLQVLRLVQCALGNEGLSIIVDAVQDNNTILSFDFSGNGITSDALHHVIRLLQRKSLRAIGFNCNPGLFNNQDDLQPFLIALRHSQVKVLQLSFCELLGQAMTALLQALSSKTTPTVFFGVPISIECNQQTLSVCFK